MPLLPNVEDLQYAAPRVRLALDAVGVTNVERMVELPGGAPCAVTIEAHVDLEPHRMGVHMSRFHELFSEAVDEAIGERALHLDRLARRIASGVVARQEAATATVRMTGRAQLPDLAPASGRETLEPIRLIGMARADAAQRTRKVLGVSATGMNACPCAQGLVQAQAKAQLADAGFSSEQIGTIIDIVPGATHNQRGTGTLLVGSDAELDPAQLLAVVHASMSSRIHELLKRSDELAVVARAHAHARFVEDSVRDMIAGTLAAGLPLRDEDVVHARQVNHESIHAHDVFAERTGLVSTLRDELAAAHAARSAGEDDAMHTAASGTSGRTPGHITVAHWLNLQ